MNNIDLSKTVVENLRRSFSRLRAMPKFSVSTDTDVNILFFKRQDKHNEIRTGLKKEFASREEFLVYSFLLEDITARTKNKLSLERLDVQDCSRVQLEKLFSHGEDKHKQFPLISEVTESYIIVNDSDVHWALLETSTEYHSVFWFESESRLFRRSA